MNSFDDEVDETWEDEDSNDVSIIEAGLGEDDGKLLKCFMTEMGYCTTTWTLDSNEPNRATILNGHGQVSRFGEKLKAETRYFGGGVFVAWLEMIGP